MITKILIWLPVTSNRQQDLETLINTISTRQMQKIIQRMINFIQITTIIKLKHLILQMKMFLRETPRTLSLISLTKLLPIKPNREKTIQEIVKIPNCNKNNLIIPSSATLIHSSKMTNYPKKVIRIPKFKPQQNLLNKISESQHLEVVRVTSLQEISKIFKEKNPPQSQPNKNMISTSSEKVQMAQKKVTTIKRCKRNLVFGKSNPEKVKSILTFKITTKISSLMI